MAERRLGRQRNGERVEREKMRDSEKKRRGDRNRNRKRAEERGAKKKCEMDDLMHV